MSFFLYVVNNRCQQQAKRYVLYGMDVLRTYPIHNNFIYFNDFHFLLLLFPYINFLLFIHSLQRLRLRLRKVKCRGWCLSCAWCYVKYINKYINNNKIFIVHLFSRVYVYTQDQKWVVRGRK